MSGKKLILITGPTGAVGPVVVNAFRVAGYPVRTLSIDAPPSGIWPNDVETRAGDVTDKIAVLEAMRGVDSVVHMAALLHNVNLPPMLQKKYKSINVGGTVKVVEASLKVGVRRIVFFSTISVYGRSDGRILTEDSMPEPETFYAKTKYDAEKIIIAAKGPDGTKIGTILRLGTVYGPRIKGNYQLLLKSLAKNRFVPIGRGASRRTMIYDKDAAQAAKLALEHPGAAGKIFNVSDGKFHTLNEIISTICKALDRTPPRLSLPIGPIRFTTGIIEDMARMIGLQPLIMRASIDKYTEDLAVDGRRIQRELGFVPQYNLLAGWQETVREMRKAGKL